MIWPTICTGASRAWTPQTLRGGRISTHKLAILETERGTKAADVRARYGLRVELELVNTLIITQPKVTVPVSISNRTTTIQRTVVWDPLMHRLEPLVCDVCGQPGEGLHLCTGGHLAHDDCLAPQCIDCKRVYCQLCDGELATCVVCQRPVCRQSLIICPTCGRGACREHQSLCHAADGQPALVVAPPGPPSRRYRRPRHSLRDQRLSHRHLRAATRANHRRASLHQPRKSALRRLPRVCASTCRSTRTVQLSSPLSCGPPSAFSLHVRLN